MWNFVCVSEFKFVCEIFSDDIEITFWGLCEGVVEFLRIREQRNESERDNIL